MINARILQTARHLFREFGYDQVKMSDIADKSNISRQTLYNYFTSKNSILLGIAEEELLSLEKVIEGGEGSGGQRKNATHRIRLFIETYTMDSFEYLDLARRIALKISSGNPYTRMHTLLTKLVREAKASGEISAEASTTTAVELLLGCYYAIIFEATSVKELSAAACRRRVNALLDAALDGLA
jgi:AcrR family transcriptional regulator